MTTEELVGSVIKSEHIAAALYGIDPDVWDNWNERVKYGMGKPLSQNESAIYEHILWKASEIRLGKSVHR